MGSNDIKGNRGGLKIGVALGGGGARGLAHIGVLKVLEREGMPINYVAGTSMGGLLGALYAKGMTAGEIEKEALELSKIPRLVRLIDIRLRLSGSGLLKGARIYRFMLDQLGDTLCFPDLKLPYAAVTTDLLSGREVVLTKGSVASAVRATISVPLIFEPVEFGEYRLVDGGMLNNVPVDVAKKLGAERVVAVDVLPNFCANLPGGPVLVQPLEHKFLPASAHETYHVQLVMISAITELRLRRDPPDVLIRPDLPRTMGLFTGFDNPLEAIRAGEAAAEAQLDEIRALLDR
jgi:NTE family protein